MFGYGDGGSGVTEEMVELMHRFDKLSIMPKTEHMRADEFLHIFPDYVWLATGGKSQMREEKLRVLSVKAYR